MVLWNVRSEDVILFAEINVGHVEVRARIAFVAGDVFHFSFTNIIQCWMKQRRMIIVKYFSTTRGIVHEKNNKTPVG